MSKRHSPSNPDAERQPSPSVRVLIVDDHEPWRRWVVSVLGVQPQLQVVGEASDGLEALRKAHELKPDISNPKQFAQAKAAGTQLPSNHSSLFAPDLDAALHTAITAEAAVLCNILNSSPEEIRKLTAQRP